MNPYLAAYLLLWAILIGYWLIHWGGNKRTVQRRSAVSRLVMVLAVIVLVVFRRQLPPFWRRPLLSLTPALEGAGLVLCAGGVAFAIWARRTLGRNWSADPTLKEGHELVAAGPYRLVRHPIYTGVLLAILGTALGGDQVADAAAFLACVASFWLKLRVEERLMQQQFPQAYPDYRRRTKALVPYVL